MQCQLLFFYQLPTILAHYYSYLTLKSWMEGALTPTNMGWMRSVDEIQNTIESVQLSRFLFDICLRDNRNGNIIDI